MSEGLDKFFKATGDAIEKVPEIYDDGLKPTVQETGKLLARIPRAINAALSVCDQWILNKEYNIEETKKLLAIKLENVSPEKIVPPEPYVAIPALQAISYSMNSDELRELYANLLSKAMNVDTKDFVHPCFTDIIKQMSPLDAKVVQEIMESNFTPLINIEYKEDKNTIGRSTLANNISWITFASYDDVLISISNLCRIGLIDIPLAKAYVDEDEAIYSRIKDTPHFKELSSYCESRIDPEKSQIIYNKNCIVITDLGLLFYKVCILPL